jgi:hypothetical protein
VCAVLAVTFVDLREVAESVTVQTQLEITQFHAHATKFSMAMPNTLGSTVWNLLWVTLVAPRILRWR